MTKYSTRFFGKNSRNSAASWAARLLFGARISVGPLHLGDQARDGEGLAGPGDAQQRLVPVPRLDARGELRDRLRLVARRLEVRHQLEFRHEATLRRGCDIHSVTFLERTEVTALHASGGTQRYCTGVEVRLRDEGETRTIEADLVVDASGAHSKSGQWLHQLDLAVPEDEVVEGYSGYSSRWFTMANDQALPSERWWKVLFLRMATPERPYFIGLFPIENRRWLLSYIGVNKSYPPRGEVDFTAALERLATPLVHQMVRRMEPISPVYSARGTRNRWRHYERWRTPLGRFIALADAACSFNPRFGQGMSAATVSARLLQQCLARYGVTNSRLSRAFFAAQARFQQTPWLFAAADDLRLPMSEGNHSLSTRLFNWYRPQLVACPDPQVAARLGQVTQFVQPMSSLFAPQIVSRVLAASSARRIKAILQEPASLSVASIPPGAP